MSNITSGPSTVIAQAGLLLDAPATAPQSPETNTLANSLEYQSILLNNPLLQNRATELGIADGLQNTVQDGKNFALLQKYADAYLNIDLTTPSNIGALFTQGYEQEIINPRF